MSDESLCRDVKDCLPAGRELEADELGSGRSDLRDWQSERYNEHTGGHIMARHRTRARYGISERELYDECGHRIAPSAWPRLLREGYHALGDANPDGAGTRGAPDIDGAGSPNRASAA
jgi:hypothetical protein